MAPGDAFVFKSFLGFWPIESGLPLFFFRLAGVLLGIVFLVESSILFLFLLCDFGLSEVFEVPNVIEPLLLF